MSTPHPTVLAGLVFADLAGTLEAIATAVLLVAAIGLGVAAFVWVRNWRQRLADDTNTEEQLASFQHMLDDGLIDPQEYERIAAQLETQKRAQHQPSPEVASGAPPEPPPSPPP
jgi:hypothetical protein